MDTTTKIQMLSNVKSILHDIVEHDSDIQQIYELVVNYIESNCVHNIVTDYIDITPDYGHNIKYCDICMKTFQS
jgi:hypothetical protein